MVTGAGSAWYDIVAECFNKQQELEAIIRPGCYAIHDTGIYLDAQNQGIACDLGGDLASALELWAYVVSRPEPNKVIVGFGKRDAAFDAGLPILERAYRNGKPVAFDQIKTTAVMDQHAFLSVSSDCDLQVGDVLVFSTYHPCLTFDKWRSVAVSDDNDRVTHWVKTWF
ncbi:predicted amino acid aldolase or racemase [Photobacterium sp. SKA34]|nr:predicted amino acid aldolase or racemase [Photobacterium sp. SKA34]